MNSLNPNKGDTMKASREWSSRPDDQRFVTLLDMRDHFQHVRDTSMELVVRKQDLAFSPDLASPGGRTDPFALVASMPDEKIVEMTMANIAFTQVAGLAGAPAAHLRKLPAALVSDELNYLLRFGPKSTVATDRDEEVGVLITGENVGRHGRDYVDGATMRAATGARYGRIWNSQVVAALVDKFGDGVSGEWKVPGLFGKPVAVDKKNTTLYASDRDLFVFLADEERRIEVSDRRDGKSGSLSRGFFTWNSEVGAATMGVGMFLFDYACENRIVWGMSDYEEVRIRHTPRAPERWLQEITPAIEAYANASTESVETAIAAAKALRLDTDLDSFLKGRFGQAAGQTIKETHLLEEQRPIETAWDVVVGATAYAKSIKHQDGRVRVEKVAGDVLRSFAPQADKEVQEMKALVSEAA